MKLCYFIFIMVIVICSIVFPDSPVAASGFRCGTQLVSTNDTRDEVLHKCGPPDNVEEWTVERFRPYPYRSKDSRINKGRHGGRRYSEKKYVNVEEWMYNRGSTRLIRFLIFENGKLKKIKSGRRGY